MKKLRDVIYGWSLTPLKGANMRRRGLATAACMVFVTPVLAAFFVRDTLLDDKVYDSVQLLVRFAPTFQKG